MDRWPHQVEGLRRVCDALVRGVRRILLCVPTGGGKTLMASDLIRLYLDEGRKVALYTNRRLLVRQTSQVMAAAGHGHGVRAAGYADEREMDFQVASIQTEAARVLRSGAWGLHEAQLVILDECHINQSSTVRRILREHNESGAAYIGLTATPIGLAGLYDELIVAGTTSELRECGALVPAHHYGPDEPDLKGIKAATGEDLTEKQAVKAIMREGIFGRVLKWFHQLNPAQAPTILFAPGVKESAWFAEQFTKTGVRAAHIDGQEVWLDGEFHRSGESIRQDVIADFKAGRIKVLCNRFVLREGVDIPEAEVGILATVFGSLQSYLQSGGRLLRACPGKERAVIIDHGGNWLRHGSLNADREWSLEYTAGMVSGLREERLRAKREREPLRCPQCARVMNGRKCPACGHEVPEGKKTRPVVQSDGTLRFLSGDAFRLRRVSGRPDGPAVWQRMYYRSKTDKGDRTFRAAMALFAMENRWGWPDESWPLMPAHEIDFFRRVADVPMERLVGWCGACEKIPCKCVPRTGKAGV